MPLGREPEVSSRQFHRMVGSCVAQSFAGNGLVNFHNGEVVYKQLTGTGWLYNNHYGSISISPEDAAYVGMMGGLVKIVDSD